MDIARKRRMSHTRGHLEGYHEIFHMVQGMSRIFGGMINHLIDYWHDLQRKEEELPSQLNGIFSPKIRSNTMTQGNTINWKVTSDGKKAFKPYYMQFSPFNEEKQVLRRLLVALEAWI